MIQVSASLQTPANLPCAPSPLPCHAPQLKCYFLWKLSDVFVVVLFSYKSAFIEWVLYASQCARCISSFSQNSMTKEGSLIISPFYTWGNWVSYPSYPAREWWRQDPGFHPQGQTVSPVSPLFTAASKWAAASLSFLAWTPLSTLHPPVPSPATYTRLSFL